MRGLHKLIAKFQTCFGSIAFCSFLTLSVVPGRVVASRLEMGYQAAACFTHVTVDVLVFSTLNRFARCVKIIVRRFCTRGAGAARTTACV